MAEPYKDPVRTSPLERLGTPFGETYLAKIPNGDAVVHIFNDTRLQGLFAKMKPAVRPIRVVRLPHGIPKNLRTKLPMFKEILEN